MTVAYDWLAVDWGAHGFRVWAMAGDDAADTRSAPFEPNAAPAPAAFERAVATAAAGWSPRRRPVPVVVCGVAGARGAWHPAGYVGTETALIELPDAAVRVPATAADTDVRILPGLRQSTPPDVMRGDETRLLGWVIEVPEHTGVVVVADEATRWVRLAEGRVERFHTAMAGEVFAVLAEHSTLRPVVTGDGELDPGDFAAAVAEARTAPASWLRRAFGLRAEARLHGVAPDLARARLAGWLTGLEVADALDRLGRPTAVTLLGEAGALARYAAALAVFDVTTTTRPAEVLTRRGLAHAHARLFGADPDAGDGAA